MTEKEHLIKYKCRLNIHHIDYNKNNCDEKNLISVCHSDNSKANKDRDY